MGPFAALSTSCWGAVPSVTPRTTTTQLGRTPSLRGAIPILCLILPLSTGGQTLAPTLGVWHLQTFNFRVIF